MTRGMTHLDRYFGIVNGTVDDEVRSDGVLETVHGGEKILPTESPKERAIPPDSSMKTGEGLTRWQGNMLSVLTGE